MILNWERRHPCRRAAIVGLLAFMFMSPSACHTHQTVPHSRNPAHQRERQVTAGPRGRVLTNTGVWSPDGKWIVYDTRSDPAGEKFDGRTIEIVNTDSGEVREVYQSQHGAHCGVATWHPIEPKIVFILGPEHPAPDWQYNAFHRQGIIVTAPISPGTNRSVRNLDARDLVPPFTPGALRGGSHVHVWEPAGEWVSFTYEDHVLAQFSQPGPDHDMNLRNVGVSAPFGRVHVDAGHPRNHDGEYFSVLVTRTVANPRPGSDEIKKACEEGWVGTNGYLRPDGHRNRRALAFQGHVVSDNGQTVAEVFIVDLPDVLTEPGEGPLAGTGSRMPFPPKGCAQRRLTFTTGRKFPGIQGPRHWLRSSPDGSAIAFLMKDEAGVVQLWTVSPKGGAPRQVTHNDKDIASAFTWSPDGRSLGHIMDDSVCLTDAVTGETQRLTSPEPQRPLRPEACVFSPDGKHLAYVRQVTASGYTCNQIFVLCLH